MGSCPDSYDGRLCGSDNHPLQVWPCVREKELLKKEQAERLFIFRSTSAMDSDSATCSQTTLTASAMRMTEARLCDVMVVDNIIRERLFPTDNKDLKKTIARLKPM